MRLSEPRVPTLPRDPEQWDADTREVLAPLTARGPGAGRLLNIFATLARHPKLLKRWQVFGNHILSKSTLPERERELVILRVGWLCRAEYEWSQHVVIGKASGLTDEEIERITVGPEAPGWSLLDAALLRAADELRGDAFMSDETWAALSKVYDTQQMMDLVFTVGQYNLVSMALNTLGVQLEEGGARFPA
ncbi:MAG: carboxymuconolactone decarboxylase family protein [Deltaproteobacteria bacterium]|nr:carboxymuconolactone decarboxylase family protein [Deltaproteobacteria bacterium]MBW2414258.1 carboxymuconolactone decarboxylase family protein [Deltaproteobacteria bacterium]